MRSLISGMVALGVMLSSGGAAKAQGQTTEQGEALKKVVAFYRQVGDETAAKQLEAAIAQGTILFGKTSENVNAECDTGSRLITVNSGSVAALGASDMRGWQATAALAETLYHEMVHQKQGRWAWTSSYWQEVAGQGNPCEQQAWGAAVQRLGDWIRATERELDSQKNAHPRVQAETARRLQLLYGELVVARNDYKGVRASIGELRLNDASGRTVDIDGFLASYEAANKKAAGTIALSKQVAVSFDGNYKGALIGPLTGRIGLKVDGYTVTGRFNASAEKSSPGFDPKGTPFDIAGARGSGPVNLKSSVSADIIGTIDVDGNLKATIKGSLTETGGRTPSTRAFSGELSGSVSKSLTAKGRWTGNGKSGTWSAAK